MNEMQLAGFKSLLTNDDDSKAFLIMLKEREAIHLRELTVTAKMAVVKLGRMSVVHIVRATVRGAPHAWVTLTETGKELVRECTSEWIDELQKWREIEEEVPVLTIEIEQKVIQAELAYFRAHVDKETSKE